MLVAKTRDFSVEEENGKYIFKDECGNVVNIYDDPNECMNAMLSYKSDRIEELKDLSFHNRTYKTCILIKKTDRRLVYKFNDLTMHFPLYFITTMDYYAIAVFVTKEDAINCMGVI